MNSLDRARKFIGNKAAKLALGIVPLAALTTITPPAAHAGSINFSTSSGCSVQEGTGNTCGLTSIPVGGDPNANWIQLYTSGSISSVTLIEGQGPDPIVKLEGYGSASGTASGDTIPIAWDFTTTQTSGSSGGTMNWSVDFSVSGSGLGSNASFTTSGSGVSFGEITGSNSIFLAAGGTLSSWSMTVDVTSPSDNFTLNVPGAKTLDLNSTASTPEPASLLLAGAGGAFLLFLRKRKRA